MTYFPLLVVAVFLKRKYSYTNITGVAQINIKEWNHFIFGCVLEMCVVALKVIEFQYWVYKNHTLESLQSDEVRGSEYEEWMKRSVQLCLECSEWKIQREKGREKL